MANWVAYINAYPNAFKVSLNDALATEACTTAIIPSCIYGTRHDPQQLDSYPCQYCKLSFSTLQRCNLHMFKTHQWLHPAHFLFAGTTCPQCLVHFPSRNRFLEHLRYKSFYCYHN